MTVYALKPGFQELLRPAVATLARAGITANTVTAISALGSVVVGVVTTWFAHDPAFFLIVPPWLFIRMALNAIDGMLARDRHQKTVLGGYLNELGDVVSDAALYAPFARVPPFDSTSIAVVIVLSMTAEFAGALGPAFGASRRYDGPLGKSDRAVVFGALGIWVGCGWPLPSSLEWGIPILSVALAATVVNRIRAGVAEATQAGSPEC